MFKINNVLVAEPRKEGVTITDEPIWAGNTGRNAKGKMIGELVAWKTTVEVEWPVLSFSEAKKIRNAIVNAGSFFPIEYYDFSADTAVTKTVYCANVPRTMYSLASSARYHIGVKIKFVEQ